MTKNIAARQTKYKSWIAKGFASFPHVVQQKYKISTEVMDLIEALVAVSKFFVGSSFQRNRKTISFEMFQQARKSLLQNMTERNIKKALDNINSPQFNELIETLTKPEERKAFKKAVGAQSFYTLVLGLHEVLILGKALTIGLQRLSPLLIAFENATALLPESTLSKSGLSLLENKGLSRTIAVTKETLSWSSLMPQKIYRSKQKIDNQNIRRQALLVKELNAVITKEVHSTVNSLSAILTKKLEGVHDALAYSRDGNGQAATSLVEFIDRLLNESFTTQEVLDWVKKYSPGTGMTYERGGEILPTKVARGLCFVYAGLEPIENTLKLSKLAVNGMARNRSELEKIKHGDTGTNEEKQKIELHIKVTEGFFLYAIKIGWSAPEQAQLLKKKLQASPRTR